MHARRTAAAFTSVLAVLAVTGCSAATAQPSPTPEPQETGTASAYACGSLASLSAGLMNGDRDQASVDAAVAGLLALVELGDEDVRERMREAQDAAATGIGFDDYVNLIEPAAVACDDAGFALSYRANGG